MFLDPAMGLARCAFIIAGIFLAYLGFKKVLEPLIMVPMGIGMIAINAGVLFLKSGEVGTIIIDPLVDNPETLVNIMQVNFLQPVYNLSFSNALIACLVFFGIGALSEIGFILARPWASVTVALFGEMGTFAALVCGVYFGLNPGEAAAVATIGGADGPMVLFASLMMAPHLFVPISVIAYLYLSLTYIGYPYLIKAMVPKKHLETDVEFNPPEVSTETKFIFVILTMTLLCLLLPVAAPLIMSFFLGVAVKEAEIVPYQNLLEKTVLYTGTLFLGLLLGTLCEAATLLNPKVIILVALGIVALFFSGVGGILGGWLIYYISRKNYNPAIGIAGVSCMPTTAKLAQHAVEEENPYAMILPLAMGANICGVIVSAIAVGIFISTYALIQA